MKIFVTGPQRSGSTFISHCLSKSFGLRHIDEMEFDVYFIDWFYKIADSVGQSWVVHAPGLFSDIIKIQERYPDITYVVVRRDISEILNSQQRISWDGQYEKQKLFMLDGDTRHVCQVKYEYWERWKPYLNSWVEYSYRDFENHPLWVDDESRRLFGPKQWHG